MRFTVAWANVQNQNITLRLCLLLTSICALLFCITTVRLSLKTPLLIERECFSKAIGNIPSQTTSADIEAFVKVALSKRFDSDAADIKSFLSDEEWNFRLKEQAELKSKSINQRVFVNFVKVDGNNISVDADRFISIEKVKTVTPFVLAITLSKDSRTASNPYGLILEKISEIKNKEDKK
jgi:hypothetical protein